MIKWNFHNALDAFQEYSQEWDTLNEKCGNHVLLDSRFVGTLIDSFGESNIVLGISQNPDYPFMVLLDQEHKYFLQTFQPSQAPLGLFLIGRQADLDIQLQSLLSGVPGLPLGLSMLQQDPMFTVFDHEFRNKSVEKVEYLDYIDTARISLVGTFEEYWEARGKNLRIKIPKLKRKLKDAELVLRIIREPDKVDECLKVYGRLETSGWKDLQGTAIGYENAQGKFYGSMLKKFCESGEAVIYQLLLDGSPIASDLCLERNGMLVVLKTTYDEEFKNLSPNFLMREEILRCLFREGRIRSVEFYGRVMEWHKKWTTEIRVMYHVNIYRNPWVRRGRSVVKQLRSLAGVK